jgi:hypothetical protein
VKSILLPHGFERVFEDACSMRRLEKRQTIPAAEGQEVEVSGLLASFQEWRHGGFGTHPTINRLASPRG